MHGRLGMAAEGGKRVAKAILRFRVGGIDRQRRSEMLDCLLITTFLRQS